MLLLRTLSRSRSLHPLSRSLSVACSHAQAFTFIADTETQSHLSTEHATETQTHLSTQHRAARQESARASERRQACDMVGLQCSRLKVATATKVVVAGERPDPVHHRIIASSHHRHDAGAPSVGACRTRSADTRSILRVCLRNSCPRALGILSTVIVVVVMEDEVLFLRWLFMFHLRLIEECDVEVLASGSRRKPWCLFECPRPCS